jgi:Tol biopolymer transport system component
MKDRLITLFAALFTAFVVLLVVGSLLGYAYGDSGATGGGYSATDAMILNNDETGGLGTDILGLVGDGQAPALSEDGARIAYYDDSYQIWTVNVDGTGRTQLTSGHFDLYPSWSPDGTKIAFRRSTMIEGSSHNDIWTMNSDGSDQIPLTDALGTGGAYDRPAWSPDGTRLAMEAAVGGMMSEIYIIDVHAKALVNVTAGNSRDNNRISHQSPAWLADGERIVLVRNDDFAVISTVSTELTEMNRKGERQAQETGNEYSPRSTVRTDSVTLRPQISLKQHLPWTLIYAGLIAAPIAGMFMMR